MVTDNELLELIKDQVNELDLIDYLGLTTQDIVAAFQDEILNKRSLFIDVVELPEDD